MIIVLKPDLVIDPVDPPDHGSDGLTRVNPGQPKKTYKKQYGVTLSCFNYYVLYEMNCKASAPKLM